PRALLLLSFRQGARLEKTGGLQPGEAGVGPGGAGAVAAADAEGVSGFGIDVEFSGDAGSAEGQITQHAVVGRTYEVGAAVRQEHRRGSGGDHQSGGEFIFIFWFEVARINEDRKIRPATDVVDIVDVRIAALLETRGRGYGQVASGGETDDADAVGIDSKFADLAADQADSALCILEGTPGGLIFGLIRP